MVALMKTLCFSFIVLASFATLFSVADAHRFYVGGNGAWVLNPHENYNSWAERNRFQVNDTLYFKYAKVSDSVQLVTKADYYGCNVYNPIQKFDNGEAKVALDRSGPFYFISGNQNHCMKGQKVVVVVLAIRNHHPKVPISPAKAPTTTQPPKSHSPVSPAKAPSTTQPPKSHSPVSPPAKAPKAHSPAKSPSMTQPPKAHSPVSPIAPAKAPSMAQPPKSSVSPVTHSPSKAPATSPATHSLPPKSPSPSTSSPTNTPRSLPSPKSPSPAASPTPSASSPAKPPASSSDPSPASPATSPTPSAPAPSPKSAATVVTVTSVMSTLLTVAFTFLMFA